MNVYFIYGFYIVRLLNQINLSDVTVAPGSFRFDPEIRLLFV